MSYCISSDFPIVVTNYCECCSDSILKYRKNSSSVALMFALYISSWRVRSNENASLDRYIIQFLEYVTVLVAHSLTRSCCLNV